MIYNKTISSLAVISFLIIFTFGCEPRSTPNQKHETTLDESTAGPWVNLLDTNLSKWDNYLSYRHIDGYSGKKPVDENGRDIVPIGYNNDQTKVFSMVKKDGEHVLRISGEIYGSLFTKQIFSNYHLKMQMKWGTKKYVPRLKFLKDTGLLYHSIGESGVDYWRAWKVSQEFQIMEGHIGDYWNVGTSAIEIRAFLPEGDMNSVADAKQPFLAFGTGKSHGFCLRSENRETANNGWTTIELITFNGKSLHIVNGKVVMVLKNSHYLKDGKTISLAEGKIQLQSEGAEAFFKNIQIKQLGALPKAYKAFYN